MTTRETLTARIRQVLDEFEHGAAGVALVERLTDAACEPLTAVLVELGAGPDVDPVVAARRMRERAEAAEKWQVRAQVQVAACAETGLNECPACTITEAALYRVIDDAQRLWGAGDRCEPIAAPITRAVTEHLRGGS